MRTPRTRLTAALTAAVFVVAACGGSDGDDAAEPADDAPAAEEPAVEADEPAPAPEEEPAEETPAEEDPLPEPEVAEEGDEIIAPAPEEEPAEEAPAENGGDAASGVVTANLVEWAIEAPTEYAAGEITFNATNGGNFPHELVVIAAESYESLPVDGGGAVVESDLPTGALIARTSRISGGQAEDLVVELAPGNYVLVCNLGSGINSHAGQGQRLDITVAG